MKRLLVIILVFVFTISMGIAQVVGGSNEKLSKAYNSGKYESCFNKAESVTYNEKTKKDPEAYLYMAMCLYELSNSENPDVQADYKNGFKDAIKYISKFVKYDKDGEMYGDNIEFINELKDLQYKKVETYFNELNYRKAASEAKQYSKLNHKKDYSLLLFVGMNEIMSNNYSQGSRNVDEAKKQIETILTTGKLNLDKRFKVLFSNAFIKYAEFLIAEGQDKDASETLSFGLKMFPDNNLLKTQQNKIQEVKQVQDTVISE